jgi:hypothetical protein
MVAGHDQEVVTVCPREADGGVMHHASVDPSADKALHGRKGRGLVAVGMVCPVSTATCPKY